MTDKEYPLPKRQRTTDPQTNRAGGAHDGGQQFEMKMAGVIGLRGMKRGDNFQLETNVTDAGNFDDLVYTAEGRWYFLQLKHTENPGTNKLVPSDLVPLLQKCFESYCSIIQNPEFKDIHNEKLEFIIYTNQHLGQKLVHHKTTEMGIDVYTIFKTSDKGRIFNFIPDDNKKIDVYTLLENSVKESKKYINLNNREKKSKLRKIKEFLNKLIIFTGQKDQWELDDLIEDEIIYEDGIPVDREEYKSVLKHFKTRLENWWRKRKDNMTPETLRDWLKKAKTESSASFVIRMYQSCTEKLGSREIKFSDSEVSRLQTELSDKRAVHLRSDALTLCSKLLLDCLPQSKCIFVTFESLQSYKNMLLHAWLGGDWEWLIVFCDQTVRKSDVSRTCSDIFKFFHRDFSAKRVIILTACSVQQTSNFVPIEHKFNFEQLSKESQEMVLEKKTDFQGCEVTMRSVLQRHGNVQHVLGPELVTDLLTGDTAVNIGGTLQRNKEYYEPRVFKRKIWLPLDILRKQRTYPDIFAVSGIETSGLVDTVPSDEKVGYFYFDEDAETEKSTKNYDVFGKRFIVLKGKNLKSSFLKLREIHSGETLHWLKYKNEKLFWKETCGDTYNLRNCFNDRRTDVDRIIAECIKSGSCEVNEESIWKLRERTVLVVAEPGMGKSSTTTQVAWHTKLANPTSWVVRINWNDHTRKLQEIKSEAFNFDSLVEFLCSAEFTESKYTDIDRILLKQALQYSGNVTVLMDGFDEISQIHADKFAVFFTELMKTNVERVLVTSRPVQRERLEKELSVIAFGMKKLSHISQKEILLNLWSTKAKGQKDKDYIIRCIDRLFLLEYDLHQDKNFTRTPLYVKMIATALEMDVEKHLKSQDFNNTPKIDLFSLYDRFIESKIHIHGIETRREDLTKDDLEMLKKIFLENLEKCSLLVTLSSELNQPGGEEIQKTIKPFLERVQTGKDNISIVMNVVEERPHFLHRSFAEYLTACWLSKNFESNRNILKRILFDGSCGIVRNIFDRILARGCPLHCAVLEEDTENVRTLLRKGCDVNAVDKGGRTVTHLIATNHSKSWDVIKQNCNYELPLHNRDRVLRWTPLQYAIKSENWFIVERLLERNIDRSGFRMIRQKAQDPQYIDSISIHAALEGHLLLLQFLCSTSANIHRARSTMFPSLLHAAIRGANLPIVMWLIEHGANCNTRYSDGQTPLFYAVSESSLDVVRAVAEEGGASLDIRDNKGRTVIDWAKECASNQGHPYREKRLKETVTYLQKR